MMRGGESSLLSAVTSAKELPILKAEKSSVVAMSSGAVGWSWALASMRQMAWVLGEQNLLSSNWSVVELLLVSVGGASVGNVGRDDDEVDIAIATSNHEKTPGSKEDGYLPASNVGPNIFNNKVGGGINPYLASEAGIGWWGWSRQ